LLAWNSAAVSFLDCREAYFEFFHQRDCTGCITLSIPKYRGSSGVFEIAVVPAKESTLKAGSLSKLTHCLLDEFQVSIVSLPIRNIHNPLSITQHN